MKRAVVQVFSIGVLGKVLIGLATILAIRYMAVAQYSTYTVALAITFIFSQTLSSAYNSVFIVGFENLSLEQESSGFLGIQIATVALFAAIFLFVTGPTPIYFAGVALALSSMLSEYSKTWHQQKMQFGRFSLIEITRSVVFFAATAILVAVLKHEVKAWQMLAAQAFALGVVFLGFGSTTGVLSRPKFASSWRVAKSIWQGNYRYLFGYFSILAVLSQTDILMLKRLGSTEQVAAYGAAFRYYSLLLLALGTVNVILLPKIQEVDSVAGLAQIITRHVKYTALFVIGIFIAIWSSAWIIPLVDKGRYPASVQAFRILALSAVISFICSPYVNLLFKLREFRFLTLMAAVGLILDLVLNSALIPSWGCSGAATATLVAFLCVNGSFWIRSRRLLRTSMSTSAADTASAG